MDDQGVKPEHEQGASTCTLEWKGNASHGIEPAKLK